jgi:hypothetical protein
MWINSIITSINTWIITFEIKWIEIEITRARKNKIEIPIINNKKWIENNKIEIK